MLISVIIPVYDGETYLKECLDSVARQDCGPLEILMVDDGSGDDSGEICAAYARRDSRFRLLSQKHAGLSAARNTGLAAAAGDYVFFLDADDVLPEEGLERLRRQGEAGFDLIAGNHYRFAEERRKQVPFHYEEQMVEAGKSTGSQRYEWFFGTGIMASAWGKLFRREFLKRNDLWFSDNDRIYEEDRMFLYQCLACDPSVCLVTDLVYGYRLSPGSLSSRYKENYPRRMTAFFTECTAYFSERGVSRRLYDLPAVHVPFSLYLCCLNRRRGCEPDPVELYQECEAVTELARGFGTRWNKEDCQDRATRIFLRETMRLLAWKRGKTAARYLIGGMMAVAGRLRGEKRKGEGWRNE